MVYYSGFSLKDDISYFKEYLKESDYTVAGFSYGAIKAFEYAISCKDRVDTLQLFSPAFFQTKSESFKRAQLRAYNRDRNDYLSHFIKGCFEPYELEKTQHIATKESELQELLEYVWNPQKLKDIVNSGVAVEVYLGSEDNIIDVEGAYEFFKQYATTYLIKGANHFLQVK